MAKSGMVLVRSTAVNCCDSGLLHITVGIGADGRVGACRIRFQGTHYAHVMDGDLVLHSLACMRMLSEGDVR
jgi:hypothetical protein